MLSSFAVPIRLVQHTRRSPLRPIPHAMPSRETGRPLRAGRWALVVLLAVAVPVAIVKRLDEDNRFCVACHLHGEIMRTMTAVPPLTLAAAHFAAPQVRHPGRCFTCHSGEGVAGWTQVTVYSAWDAARWVAGDRHEPTSMRLPITNAACLKCHANQVHGSHTAEETNKFHQLGDHSGLKLACVGCHVVHPIGEASRTWLHKDIVQGQCARCHKDLAADSG